MRALLLPIKDLRNSKQRLAGVLTPDQRFELAHAMLQDTFRAVRDVRHADAIFIVTSYAPAIHQAKQNGWRILEEQQQISESASVDFASQQCQSLGVTALLRLPLDLPLVRATDIDELLAIDCSAPSVIVVQSRDGTGTNAILRTPPVLFPSHFGPGSFAKHSAEAERCGARVIVRRNPRIEMDVDDESDLRALFQHDLSGTATGLWLERNGFPERLRPQDPAAPPNDLAQRASAGFAAAKSSNPGRDGSPSPRRNG